MEIPYNGRYDCPNPSEQRLSCATGWETYALRNEGTVNLTRPRWVDTRNAQSSCAMTAETPV